MSPLKFFGILSILEPKNKGTIGQSWRASPRFILQEDFKESRDRCEGGQNKLRNHLLQESSVLLPKLRIPFPLCSITLHYNLLWSTAYFSVSLLHHTFLEVLDHVTACLSIP